ncbi:AAA family ATPase [Gulosibacter sp. 10]|uniref:AAA family ATPase n=1 Tax=Gulosibacter sp. 10 TaxID=1255570 RepID=UPI00097E97D6|nr:AAA family ATPase [Gulosibacter sp. 10]SJM71682.1 probable RuBisCo-expression protein CbbX [Gulosibacter sp. 10]
MAVIRVNQGHRGPTLLEALQRATGADTVLLGEGVHVVDPVYVGSARIAGRGDPERTVLQTRIEVRGALRLEDLTLRAPHFDNALQLADGARAELRNVVIQGDPAAKYPAIYDEGGALVLRGCTVRSGDEREAAVFAKAGATVEADGTAMPVLRLEGATANLADVRCAAIMAADRSRVTATGTTRLAPAADRRCLVLQNESVAVLQHLRQDEGPFEALCEDSFLQLDAIDGPEGRRLTVIRTGASTLRAPEGSVTDTGAVPAPPPEPEAPRAPKVVPWRAADARRFAEAVAPALAPGDTVLMEEGEYFLEDHDGLLRIGVDLAGRGRVEATVLHGSLAPMAGGEVAISNLTIRPPEGRNALYATESATTTLTNVVLETEPTGEYPAIYAEASTVRLLDSEVVCGTDSISGVVTLIGAGTRLEARGSLVGWLQATEGAAASLDDCSAVQICAIGGSTVESTNGLTLYGNEAGQRAVYAAGGSTARFERIATEDAGLELGAEASTVIVDRVEAPEGGGIRVVDDGDAHVEVAGEPVGAEEEPAGDELAEEEPAADETGAAPEPVRARPGGGEEAQAAESAAPEAGAEFSGDHASPEGEAEDPLAEIGRLTGLARVKEQIESFTRMVEFNQRRRRQGLKTTDLTMHSVFLGNPGTGKTTVARLLQQALYRAGAVARDKLVEVQRRDLVAEHLGESANLTQAVLERARGGVLFIDEAYSLYQERNNEFAQEAVDTILTFMENNRDEIVVIFAGYTDRMQDFLQMNPGLQSRIPNRFDFEDYSAEEVAEIGYRQLLDEEYRVDEDEYRRAVMAEYRRSNDRSNGRWVRNFNERLVKQMARRVVDGDDEDTQTITAADLAETAGGDTARKAESAEELLQELDGLVGLEPVKSWVRDLTREAEANARLAQLGAGLERPTYHMVFTGNPGTGKTTVADIIARLFYNLGILATPTVKVVDRSDLVGAFIGHSERNTTKAIDEAMGGVLFVDEAYQLHVEGTTNDFGRMAIETFMTRLENDRDRFVAIFAGYTDEMDAFLGANPGLRSRIPLRIEFPDYTPEEVARIVVVRLARVWRFDEALLAGIAAGRYASLPEAERSNGRWARNFAQEVEKAHKRWLVENDATGDEAMRIRDAVIRGFEADPA